jgi:dihydroorotase
MQITLIKPFDAHLHLRDGFFLHRTVPDAARQFGRAIVMPNLKPPLTQLQQVRDYKDRILKAIPAQLNFEPLMTLYLTSAYSPAFIKEVVQSQLITAIKLYPAGITTNAEAGIQNLESCYPIFEAMQAHDLPLLIHGEAIDPKFDIFDREKYFLDDLTKIQQHFPELRIVLEHITTADAVHYISEASNYTAATITAHHLLLNRNDLLSGGIRPHYYCLPILKRIEHQQALIKAATSGNPKFFLGTDSAPHSIKAKETSCGCAGIYTAHAAIEFYATIFERENCLDQLENFASRYAADFYKLPYSQEKVILEKKCWQVAEALEFGNEKLKPFYAGEKLDWKNISFS